MESKSGKQKRSFLNRTRKRYSIAKWQSKITRRLENAAYIQSRSSSSQPLLKNILLLRLTANSLLECAEKWHLSLLAHCSFSTRLVCTVSVGKIQSRDAIRYLHPESWRLSTVYIYRTPKALCTRAVTAAASASQLILSLSFSPSAASRFRDFADRSPPECRSASMLIPRECSYLLLVDVSSDWRLIETDIFDFSWWLGGGSFLETHTSFRLICRFECSNELITSRNLIIIYGK